MALSSLVRVTTTPVRSPVAALPRVRLGTPHLIVLGSLAAAALTLLLPTAPTYDPWAWIVWGREIAQLDLDTVDGPSWKPLPVVFTTLFSLFGEAAPELWVLVARAGAIAALPLAFLLASRLGGIAAGAGAAAALLVGRWWLFNGAMGNSEGLLVAIVLGAILAHLHGRRGWAFAGALGVAMLRPEGWPAVALYAAYLLWEERSRLPWLAAGLVSVPVLWLGPELWGSGNAFRAADRAQQPNAGSAAFADLPWLQVLSDFVGMLPWLAVAGLVAAPFVVRREDRRLAAALAALAAAWLALVMVMTSGGFSGNQRYLVVPAVLAIVIAAGALGRVLRRLPAVLAAALAAAAFVAPDVTTVPTTLDEVDYQSQLITDLEALPEVRCGPLHTGPRLVPAVAWRYGVHASDVGLQPVAPATVLQVRVKPELPRAPRDVAGARLVAERGAWRLGCAR